MGKGVSEHGRVCRPQSFPRERVVVGELHLVRTRLDAVLEELSQLACANLDDEGWLRVEEAGAVGAVFDKSGQFHFFGKFRLP